MVSTPTALAYVDASVLVRTLLDDEPGHEGAVRALSHARGRAVSWAAVQVEAASALRSATRARRTADPAIPARRLAALLSRPDSLMLLPGADPALIPLAVDIAGRQRIRALDAMHLATALTEGRRVADRHPLVFITADSAQAEAAAAEGLEVVVP